MTEIPKAVMLEFRRELRTLPAKKRIDRILERKDAMRVVRSLPVHDLYATIREVGIEDSLELLELTSAKQVQAFLDLDGWRGDRVDGGAMATWLRALMAANPDRAVGQIRGLDLELITLLFKLHCHVYDLAAEEEPAEDDVGMHSITPDRRFLIVYGGVGDDENMNGVLKEAIDRMCGRDMMFVLRLCEALRWELPSALEEESFRWRNARLADLGFLPRHEALEVLSWRDPDGPLDSDRSAPKPAVHDEDSLSTDLSTSVVFPWDALNDGAAAFAQAARDLGDEGRERVAHEVMLTANRVHAAEGGDAGDAEAVRGTARQVIDTVGVALSYRAQGDPARLGPLLAATPGVTLFRIGHSLSLKLQRELRSRVDGRDSGLKGHGIVRLDSPLREVAAGLLRPRPLLFCGLLDPKRLDFRPPSSLVELAALSRAVAEIGFRAALLGPRGFGIDDDKLAALGEADPAEHPSHGAIVGAMLVRSFAAAARPAAAGTSSDGGPIDESILALARKLLDDPTARAQAIGALAEKASAFAPLPGAVTAVDVDKRVRAYAAQVLDAISVELRFVDDDPDRRFVTTVWMKRTPSGS
jgi:hypothetical protein